MKANLSLGTKGWADRINDAWLKSAEQIVVCGQILVECKRSVMHGEFERMLKTDLVFDRSMAHRLMAIAGDVRIANPAILQLLPRTYTTLYALSKLDDDQFNQALKDGTINPKMKGSDVPSKRKRSPKGAAVQAVGAGDISPAGEGVTTPQDAAKGEDSGITFNIDCDHDWVANPVSGIQFCAHCRVDRTTESPKWAAAPHAVTLGITTPQDDREGEDSGVTDCEREENAATAEDWAVENEMMAASYDVALGLVPPMDLGNAGRALEPAPTRPAQIRGLALGNDEGSPAVTFRVGPEPISRLYNGLLLAMNASEKLGAATAALDWPQNIPLVVDEVEAFRSWLADFICEVRDIYGAGNDTGIGL